MSDFLDKQLYIGDWVKQAACTGLTSIFFAPVSERPQATARREARAKAICERCPVFDDCRTYAREKGEYGFWAGENEFDRALAGYPPYTGMLRPTTLNYYKRVKAQNNEINSFDEND
jgi:WhiB family redox-sensing transcriptional regulator